VRLISLKRFLDSELLASLGQTSSRSGEFFVIAAGGFAMLLVVGIFDMFGLFP
jgi:hypothetical protein